MFTDLKFNAQIRHTQQRLLNRQRMIDVRTTTLARKIEQQMIEPATLLLAFSIGFILGELTKCTRVTNDKQPISETSPLKTGLSLLASARTIYAALPLAWIMTSRYQTSGYNQRPERQTRADRTKRTRTR